MFASIYHARVFLCVYINSRKIAFRMLCRRIRHAIVSRGCFVSGEDAFTVDGQGRERVEESRTRLFHAYFILHGIASRIRSTREAAVPFSKTRAERGRRVSSLVVELVSTYVKQNEVVFFSRKEFSW